MLHLVCTTTLLLGAPELAPRPLPPTWVSRSVRYPRPPCAPAPRPLRASEDVPRSVRYPRTPPRPTPGRATVVISPMEAPSVAVSPKAVSRLLPRAHRRTVALARIPRRAARRPAAATVDPDPLWISAPRRPIVHHRGHRLPATPRPTRAWAPDHDRRPYTKRAPAMTSAACLARLTRLKVGYRHARSRPGMQTPVVITGPVNGVKLTPMWGKRPALMDCRFALRLYRIAPIIRRVGVNELRYAGFYRYRNISGSRRLSRHANGLAADIFAVRGPGGFSASVLRDWVKAKGRPGDCVGGVTDRKGRVLRRLACALEYSGLLYLVLTPDSDYVHRNHFHWSAPRVGESTVRNRYAGRKVRRVRRRRSRR